MRSLALLRGPRDSIRRRFLPLCAAVLLCGGALLGLRHGSSHAAVGSFDVAALRPYFEGGSLAEIPRRLRAGEAAPAAQAIAAYLKEHPRAKDRTQARFLLALSQLKDRGSGSAVPQPGDSAEAVEPAVTEAARTFDSLASDYSLLAPYHRLYAARAYLQGGRPIDALDRARKVPEDSVLACEARYLQAESLRRLKQVQEAEGAYAAYLDRCPSGRRAEALGRRAELLSTLGRASEAVPLLRRLYLADPLSSFGVLADRQLDKLPEAERRFSAKELLGRAQVFFDNMRNPESETAFRRALSQEATGRDEESDCVARFHLAQSVFKQRQRPRAAPLFDDAILACGKNEELHMKALYQGARCYGSRGELSRAAELFEKAEAAHPGHSYADDSRLRQAEMYADLQDKLEKLGPQAACQKATCPDYEARITELLGTLPDRYAGGDQRAEALWRLALRAYRKKDYARAEKSLQESLRRVPRETGWAEEGRTLYWLGRLAEIGGKDGAAHYQQAARDYPLSYYALLSINRLRERSPEIAKALLAELTREPAEEAAARTFRFPDRPLFHQAGFLRAVELLRLGLGAEAQRELAAVGVKLPEGKGYKPASPEEEELLWLAALLYQGAGDFHRSHWIPRHSLTAHQLRYPTGAARKQWLLSYPRGYEELLVPAAKKNGQPEALQLAIVREESAFDPLTESFANAIGLTQMIPPTAQRFSGGLPTTREALRDPATNVAIGARFLGFLWSTMQGHPVLAVAGYNAGEGAVFRWLKARGDLDADAFVETIPFDETRGYTKRVLASYLVYSWLYGDGDLGARLPVVPLKLPSLPQARAAATKEEDPHRK